MLVVGDVVGHGLQAARRAAFVRTTFAATAPFSDDPARLLSWANSALVERAGAGDEFVTAACVTYLPSEQRLRWAYAGHPPALWLDDGVELAAPGGGIPLGVRADPGCVEGSRQGVAGRGVLLYTDGLTEARRDGDLFGRGGQERRPSSPTVPASSSCSAASSRSCSAVSSSSRIAASRRRRAISASWPLSGSRMPRSRPYRAVGSR